MAETKKMDRRDRILPGYKSFGLEIKGSNNKGF